jgi:hypothetical protein
MNHAAIFQIANSNWEIQIDEERNQEESTSKESRCRQKEVAQRHPQGCQSLISKAPVTGPFFVRGWFLLLQSCVPADHVKAAGQGNALHDGVALL